MQSTRQTFLLLTLCLCASSIWALPSSAVFDRVFNDLADGGKGIIDGLRKATDDGAKSKTGLLKNLKDLDDGLLGQLAQLGHDLSDAITESFKTGLFDLSANLKRNIPLLKLKVAAEKNKVRKQALSKGLAKLEKLNDVTHELKSGVLDLTQKLGEKVNKQINQKLEALDKWNEEQLDRVHKGTKGAGVLKAVKVLEELNQKFKKSLVDVLEELEFKKTLIEQTLNDKIDEYSGHVKNLIDTMHRCGIIGSNDKCQNDIEESVENLNDAENELKSLILKGKALLKDGLDASQTFANLLKQLAKDKLKCEKDLDEIIENENETETENGSTTEGVTDDAEPQG